MNVRNIVVMVLKLFWYPINSNGNSIAGVIENNIVIIPFASALFRPFGSCFPFFDHAGYT